MKIKNNKEINVAVVGGGPSGVSCAINLLKYGKLASKKVNVTIFESKNFSGEPRYNQCIGVLSPPIKNIIEENLKIPFPNHIVQRLIRGYYLYSDSKDIYLEHGDDDPSYAVRRINFDEFFMNEALKLGINRIPSRVTDIEFFKDRVILYSDSSPSLSVDIVVGAFGLDDGSCHLFERNTNYVPPLFLESIITKIHPANKDDLAFYKDSIYAFLTSARDIEFGAITPKGNHISINIAGGRITSDSMHSFIDFLYSKKLLPFWSKSELKKPVLFKGRFPINTAQNIFDDRYIMIGDAAGMMRPFKGKGINSAIITGDYAARTIIQKGIKRENLQFYYSLCNEITEDIPYGKMVRFLVNFTSNFGLMDHILSFAKDNEELKEFLFYCVSGQKSYKNAFKTLNKIKIIRDFIGI